MSSSRRSLLYLRFCLRWSSRCCYHSHRVHLQFLLALLSRHPAPLETLAASPSRTSVATIQVAETDAVISTESPTAFLTMTMMPTASPVFSPEVSQTATPSVQTPSTSPVATNTATSSPTPTAVPTEQPTLERQISRTPTVGAYRYINRNAALGRNWDTVAACSARVDCHPDCGCGRNRDLRRDDGGNIHTRARRSSNRRCNCNTYAKCRAKHDAQRDSNGNGHEHTGGSSARC